MTKTIFCSLLFIFSLSTIHAQDGDRRDNFEFGVKAGANISNVYDSRSEDFTADPKAGFVGGVFVGIPIGKFFGFQPELLFSQKGFKGSGTLLGTNYSFERTTSYIDIPLQLQIKPASFITIVAGPQFSYLLKQNDEYTFGANSVAQEQEFDNDDIRKNMLGFVGGFDLLFKNLVLSSRIGWDFQENTGDGNSLTPRYKNQWLQFTLGLKL